MHPKLWRTVALAIVCVEFTQTASGAFFEGATLPVTYRHRANFVSDFTFVTQVVTVGPGVELPSFGKNPNPSIPPQFDLFSIDISDTDILITLLVDQPENTVDNLQFADLQHQVPIIKGAFLDPSSTWAGASQSGVDFGPDAVIMNVSALSGKAGQFALLHVTPEPATVVLTIAGLVPLALRRRWLRNR